MKDILGNEITVGALVAYPVRSGSTTYLNVLRVTSLPRYTYVVTGTVERSSAGIGLGKTVTLTATDRLVVVGAAASPERPAPAVKSIAEMVRDALDGRDIPATFASQVIRDYNNMCGFDFDSKYKVGGTQVSRLKEAADRALGGGSKVAA
jgi:hypothetical protein